MFGPKAGPEPASTGRFISGSALAHTYVLNGYFSEIPTVPGSQAGVFPYLPAQTAGSEGSGSPLFRLVPRVLVIFLIAEFGTWGGTRTRRGIPEQHAE